MDDQVFSILEFDHLRALIRDGAQTPMGSVRIDELGPLEDPNELTRALAATAECVQLRKRGVRWSFSGLGDPSEAIGRLRVEGASLGAVAILELARLCEQAMSARASILAERDTSPVLSEIVASL